MAGYVDVSQVSERNGAVLLDTPARYWLESAGRLTAERAQCHGGACTGTTMHADPQLHAPTRVARSTNNVAAPSIDNITTES